MRKPVVLLIEDNGGDAILLQDALREVGFECAVVTAENAVQAYRFLQRRAPYSEAPAPDLVLLDLNLPVISGGEFLRELRRDARWRDLPVIVFSSSRREADVTDAIALGALRYLPKPPLWTGYVDSAREIAREWHAYCGAA